MALYSRARVRHRLWLGEFITAAHGIPGFEFRFPRRRAKSESGPRAPRIVKRWPEDRFDRLGLSRDSSRDGRPKSLLLRQLLLHELGEQQSSERRSQSTLRQSDASLDGFL